MRRLLLDLDRRGSQALRFAERPGPLHAAAAILAHSGDSWFWGLGLGIIWLANPAGSGGPTGSWRVWALRVFLAVLSLALAVLAIKFLVRRQRPEGEWGSIYRTADPHSFPSGHAARAALLLVLISGWGPPWLAPVLLAWAPAMSLSRVALGLHFLSDVAGGAALGIAAGAAWLLWF